ncbi:hypothetical protein BCR33DRAFT_710872 [Rhizoclosmatium globosum]|uniref:F-box domain-containing protein n=1 Tax=Rhizoclosmatium globosum TaxID=329046 RepID=A0A1Y2D2C1_9FUNG|nr:hypothetical protein BCR33DRAFT_710872 [Rhizoclosmatium globosum]|eukprot:ORY53441.1 hypothetical protein BCR33DRAFT_710872 [Rhizoclosmatium globosum]
MSVPCEMRSCTCCKTASTRIEALETQLANSQRIVEEYRSLLVIDEPDATESIKIRSNLRHLARNSLQNLPTEILNLIVCYMDHVSIFPLCHALQELKYISASIFRVSKAFKERDIEKLWPKFEFPTIKQPGFGYNLVGVTRPAPIEVPARHLLKVLDLSKLLTKFEGSAHICPPSVEYLDSIKGLLPKNIHVTLYGDSWAPEDSTQNRLERLCSFGRNVKSLTFPVEMSMNESVEVVPFIEKLNVSKLGLAINIPTSIHKIILSMQSLVCVALFEFEDYRFDMKTLEQIKNLQTIELYYEEVGRRRLRFLRTVFVGIRTIKLFTNPSVPQASVFQTLAPINYKYLHEDKSSGRYTSLFTWTINK